MAIPPSKFHTRYPCIFIAGNQLLQPFVRVAQPFAVCNQSKVVRDVPCQLIILRFFVDGDVCFLLYFSGISNRFSLFQFFESLINPDPFTVKRITVSLIQEIVYIEFFIIDLAQFIKQLIHLLLPHKFHLLFPLKGFL